MTAADQLAAIEARQSATIERLSKGDANMSDGLHAMGDRRALLALVRDQAAKLEAVTKVVDEKYLLWAAICGNTCNKDIVGVDHDAIADEVANAIRAALGAGDE